MIKNKEALLILSQYCNQLGKDEYDIGGAYQKHLASIHSMRTCFMVLKPKIKRIKNIIERSSNKRENIRLTSLRPKSTRERRSIYIFVVFNFEYNEP